MDASQLTQEFLKNALEYSPETGRFVWKQRFGKRGVPGRVAGTVDFQGYVVVTINRKRHKAHRLAWLYVYGHWPAVGIDHKNGIRTDNRLENLREADAAQNQHNRCRQINNKTGYMGVSFDKKQGKFRAGIRVAGRSRQLGMFENAQDAHMAYLGAKAQLHPFQPVPRDA